jgi:hypothetical protein
MNKAGVLAGTVTMKSTCRAELLASGVDAQALIKAVDAAMWAQAVRRVGECIGFFSSPHRSGSYFGFH